jgi:hypothetical protein
VRRPRRGIALPAVLAVSVALAALAALALFDAAEGSRLAGLAGERALVRGVALEAAAAAAVPPDAGALCLRGPTAPLQGSARTSRGVRIQVAWRHLGDGLIRAEVELQGPRGTRERLLLLQRPDSATRDPGYLDCARARRLVPAAPEAAERTPEG